MMAAPSLDPGALRGTLLEREPLARYTTWRVGGPADRLYRPADVADLAAFLATLPPEEPLFWLGLGSNLLVRDGGIRGTVVVTAGLLRGLDLTADGGVRAEAGVACAKLARFAGGAGLTGAEFMAGIPGTVGGALAMNAGAFGGETWPLVRRVEVIARNGARRTRGPEDYRIGYRSVAGPAGEWFLAAEFALHPGSGSQAGERIRELLRRRGATQPTGQASCGSVFRNPPGDHAGRLIEACGLKGARIGAAEVSPKHANFIINTGGARAADIEALMARVQVVVAERCGVRLESEVRVVGEREESRDD